MVLGLLTGCGGGTSDTSGGTDKKETGDKGNDTTVTSTIEVGIILPTKDEPRWLQDQKQFETVLDSAGFTNQVLFSQASSETERKNVETLIEKGMKVLIMCPQDAAEASEAVEKAKEAGVTVISYDRLITDTEAVDYYVTFDSFAVGEAQGQYIVDNAPKGSDIPLYLYAGAASDNNAFLFFEGAWSILQPKIADGTFKIVNSKEAESMKDKADLSKDEIGKIIAEITTDWDFNVAKKKAEEHLSVAGAEYKGDVVVLAPNDGTSRAISDAFSADSAITNYVITGQDSEQASVQYIIDGKQSMTVFKDTRTLAADSVDMAVSILEGKTPNTDATYDNEKKEVPAKQASIVVVTKDNVKSALVDSGYYEASLFTGLE
ncbi:MAG: sugar-binding protein [Lachnospiraceae bacterium]|nr:sugar-binding protein [Lachnospiraceae bacterium]